MLPLEVGIITTKKLSCPSIFFLALLKTAVIDKLVPALFESAGIGNPIMVAQNQHFTNRYNRKPIVVVFKYIGIGSLITLE